MCCNCTTCIWLTNLSTDTDRTGRQIQLCTISITNCIVIKCIDVIILTFYTQNVLWYGIFLRFKISNLFNVDAILYQLSSNTKIYIFLSMFISISAIINFIIGCLYYEKKYSILFLLNKHHNEPMSLMRKSDMIPLALRGKQGWTHR